MVKRSHSFSVSTLVQGRARVARLFVLAFGWSLLFAETSHTCDEAPPAQLAACSPLSGYHVLPAVAPHGDTCLACAVGGVSLTGLGGPSAVADEASSPAPALATTDTPRACLCGTPSLRAPPLAATC